MTEGLQPDISGPARASRVRVLVIVAATAVLAGVVLGGLWAWIAPPIHAVVAVTHSGERVHDYLGNESEHFFVAPALMLGLLTVLAVVAAVAAWQWRARRGPGMVCALSLGMVLAAGVAAALGVVLVRLSYGAVNFDAVPLSGKPAVAYVVQAPPVFFSDRPLQAAVTLLWPAGIAAMMYAVRAAADARDDLGALPSIARASDALPARGGGAPEAAVS